MLPRRDFLALAAATAVTARLPGKAFAAIPTGVKVHGLSAFGDLKYKPDFMHFDYVSVDAPQGGTFNFSPPNWGQNQSPLTFNTLNSFVPKGDAPQRMEMCFDSLMVRALDEPDAVYGLIASGLIFLSIMVSALGTHSRIPHLHAAPPKRRLTPIIMFREIFETLFNRSFAEDVAFTFKLLKDKGHPDYTLSLTHLDDAVAKDAHTVELRFSGKQSARTILNVVGFPILSKAFFTANPFDSSPLNPPLGSGAYKVGRWSAGTFIEYERVADYWGNDLPVNRGQNNFQRIRIEFYQDRTAGFEAFKKGEILYREEFTSRVWATAYDFPAFTAGKVVKHEFPAETVPSMQATAVNQR